MLMNKTIKRRLVFVCLAVLLSALVLFCLTRSSGPGYRAESIVLIKSYTNAVFSRSFELQVIHSVPAVRRLLVTPSRAVSASGSLSATNGALIRIYVIGATAQEVTQAANDASLRLRQIILERYGISSAVVAQAFEVRRYSYFHDSFQPGIARLFGH